MYNQRAVGAIACFGIEEGNCGLFSSYGNQTKRGGSDMMEAIIGIGSELYIMFVFSCCASYIFVRYSEWHWTPKALMTILFLPIFALMLPILGGILMAKKYIEILQEEKKQL